MFFSTADHKQFVRYFVVLFYALALYKLVNGMWLFQNVPFVFRTRFDGTVWLFMQTGLHQWLLNNYWGCLLLDLLFYSMPVLYGLVFAGNQKRAPFVAGVMLLVNMVYVLSYTLFPTTSIEGHVQWLLLPMLLMCTSLHRFYLLMHALRYFFLFFFFSAGVWKLYQGGVFEPLQMSGILLLQHKHLLADAAPGWYASFIYSIIQHPAVGYALYVAATVAELIFIVGFLTKKMDRWLLILFAVFLLMDLLIMKIPYFEVLPLAIPFLFSHKKEPPLAETAVDQ